MALHEDRNGCALHGALRLLDAVDGLVPILHSSAGCGVAGRAASAAFAGAFGQLGAVSGETSATILQEKQVVFGGTSRLREQIKNTLKVLAGDLYVVVTGCVPEVVGDDVPAMVKEATEQRFPVLGIAAPGFKGNGWAGYASTARALLEQLPAVLPPDGALAPFDVNLLGVVPGHDPGWEGDLLAVEGILAEAGLRSNRLVGLGQETAAWRQAPLARVNVVLSPWGLDAARVLAERHGTPVVELGFVPVGSRDAALLLEQVADALSLGQSAVGAARGRLDARLRHFLKKAAPSLLLGDVQERIAVVGGTAAAVGQARFLSGTLGQLVEQVIVTDRPPAGSRAAIAASIRAIAGDGVDVRFLESREEIARALAASSPELILGSALERPAARELGAALVESAAPVRSVPVLRRSFAGVDGAVTLVEELLGAVRREREEATRAAETRPEGTRTATGSAGHAAVAGCAASVPAARLPIQLHQP
jgi:nitrogenase molybdenum-iron protein beta chain